MKFAKASKLDRKSGGAQWRDLLWEVEKNPSEALRLQDGKKAHRVL
jgi:hypothetical protein